MLCPQSPLNRFSKVICQNVHGILGNNISHVQLCASIFHFLILRVNNSTYQEQDGEEEMEQHGVEQDLLDEDDQLLLLHDLAYEP